mmetsp:Transcript_60650/g.172392  ORF Transcript_60650/g.172392 Transcript_60650/m.172392 type:complete len:84 (+) Transcript_60650:664-915(+)
MLCLADKDPPAVGTAEMVGIVGADTEPAATGTATGGGPGGGVREPSKGAPVLGVNSLRDTPAEAPRPPADDARAPPSSLLAAL